MKAQYDNYFGRLGWVNTAATDTYAEAQQAAPAVIPSGSGQASPLYVPVIKSVEFQLSVNSAALNAMSADAYIRTCLMAGDATLYSAYPTQGIADPNMIACWELVNCLTTSGEVVFETVKRVDLPGDGVILTAPYMTLMAHNTATGCSIAAACRVWYDYVLMDQMTYMRSIHGLM